MTTQEILMIVFGSLFAISEVLGSVSFIKANSIYQVIFRLLGAIVGKKTE